MEITKNLTRGIIKGPLNSIISKYFKINLRWSEDKRLNYTQMSTMIKFFFMDISFITFYLIQYHKNAFHKSSFFLFIPS